MLSRLHLLGPEAESAPVVPSVPPAPYQITRFDVGTNAVLVATDAHGQPLIEVRLDARLVTDDDLRALAARAQQKVELKRALRIA